MKVKDCHRWIRNQSGEYRNSLLLGWQYKQKHLNEQNRMEMVGYNGAGWTLRIRNTENPDTGTQRHPDREPG